MPCAQSGVVVYTCYPSTEESEAGEATVQDHPSLQNETEASLGCSVSEGRKGRKRERERKEKGGRKGMKEEIKGKKKVT